MIDNGVFLLSELLLTYWIHSSLFVGAVLIAVKFNQIKSDKQGEWLMKSAIIAGFISCLCVVFGDISILPNNQYFNVNLATHTNDKVVPSSNAQKLSESLTYQYIEKNDMQLNGEGKLPKIPAAEANKKEVINNQVQTQHNKNTIVWPSFDIKDFSLGLSLFWLFGVLILSIYKLYQFFKLQKLLNCREPVECLHLKSIFDDLVNTAKFKQEIKLSQSACINSPLVFSANEVILPENFSENFQQNQIKAALAHELAHLKRKDTVWLKLSHVIETIFFIQPLNHLLNRQIYQLAEQRSDLLAAKWTGDPRALAEALSVTAHINFQSNQTNMVFAMKSKKSNLLVRVENLLQNSKHQTNQFLIVLGLTLSAGILVTAPGLSINKVQAQSPVKVEVVQPKTVVKVSKVTKVSKVVHPEKIAKTPKAVKVPKVAKVSKVSKTSSVTRIERESSNVNHFSMSSTKNDLHIRVEGEIDGQLTFNDAETAIANFPKNSFLNLVYDNGTVERKLIIERKQADVVYTFHENGNQLVFDKKAQDWFASVIPVILRTTGFNAKERINRIRQRYGDEGVLDEIELISSDHISGIYLVHLFEQSKLSDQNIMRTIDSSLGIQSDFEQGKVLTALVNTQNIAQTKLWLALLSATKNISSDFEQAKVLTSFIELLPQDKKVQQTYFDVSHHVNSDFEMRKLFSSYLQKQKFGDDGVIALLKAANEISSDFELSSLLIEVAEMVSHSSKLFPVYLELSDSIHSDFEMHRAFSQLLKSKISKENLIQMLSKAGDEISSDFELASLLVEAVDTYATDDEVINAIKKTSENISSRFERGRVFDRLERI